jgi:DNA-binding NarL/FixJ family response regulator
MERIRVAVVDEHDILRRGLAACVADDPGLELAWHGEDGPPPVQADVAVVSALAARRHRLGCPVLVCDDAAAAGGEAAPGNTVAGVLPRTRLTADQLVAAVRAAAAGLRVDVHADRPPAPRARLDARAVRVLELLAAGHNTREIAAELAYSERTIKTLINSIEREFDARSRAQAVARAIEAGLI